MTLRRLASSTTCSPVGDDPGRVRVHEYELPAGFRLHGHGHAGTHLCYVADGSFEEQAATNSRWCGPRSLRLSPPGDQHDMRIGQDGLRCLVLHAPELDGPRPDGRLFSDDPRLAALAGELERELAEGNRASPLVLESVALELLAQAQRRESPRAARQPPRWVLQLRDRLHDTHREPLALGELARDVDRHPMHVTRTFREHFGCSIGDYARRLQAEDARRWITGTSAPLTEIALAAGYTDQSHMTRHLRRLLGCTPGQLRRASRGMQIASSKLSEQ